MSTKEKIANLKAMMYIEGVSQEQLRDLIKAFMLYPDGVTTHLAGMRFTIQELREAYESI